MLLPPPLHPCPVEWVPMVTPPLCGVTKVGILILPSQILPFDSLPFSHPLLGLASCSARRLVSQGVPMETRKEIWKEKHKGLLHLNLNEEGRKAPWSSSLYVVETWNLSFKSCFQFVNLFILPVSWFIEQKLSCLWRWARRNIFLFKFNERLLLTHSFSFLPLTGQTYHSCL